MKFKIWFNDGTAFIWTLPSHIRPAKAEQYFKGMTFRNRVALMTEITREVVKVEQVSAINSLIALNAETEWTVGELKESLGHMGIDADSLLQQIKS